MKVLVTGSNGYIGTRMGPFLRKRGHAVTGLDTGFYNEAFNTENTSHDVIKIIKKDTRNVTEEDLRGFEAIIHLADLSNDPLGHQDEKLTYDINYHATLKLAILAKNARVKRFIYSSSCSVYGIATEEMVNEDSQTNPQTAYAKCKVLVEEELKKLADEYFSPTMMRNATVYGSSARMRFDLVVNNLSGLAWTTKEIKMTSDGSPWRPLVHILDVCEAFAKVLESPKDKIHNQLFNVGSSNGNYRIKEVAEIIAGVFPGCKISFGKSDGDSRSYKVSFEKINKVLIDFNPQRTVADGAAELKRIFEKINLSRDDFESRHFTRLKQIEHLKKTGQIDEKLFWI